MHAVKNSSVIIHSQYFHFIYLVFLSVIYVLFRFGTKIEGGIAS